jgi:hypothetical protein
MRLTNVGGSKFGGPDVGDLNALCRRLNTYNEVRSASMELSAESRVLLVLARYVHRPLSSTVRDSPAGCKSTCRSGEVTL